MMTKYNKIRIIIPEKGYNLLDDEKWKYNLDKEEGGVEKEQLIKMKKREYISDWTEEEGILVSTNPKITLPIKQKN